jgi:RimJ/RimL family protein N-acetyltransferase
MVAALDKPKRVLAQIGHSNEARPTGCRVYTSDRRRPLGRCRLFRWGNHQRAGVVTEAALAVCHWLASIGIAQLHAHIHKLHAGSHGIALRLGMRRIDELDPNGVVPHEPIDPYVDRFSVDYVLLNV